MTEDVFFTLTENLRSFRNEILESAALALEEAAPGPKYQLADEQERKRADQIIRDAEIIREMKSK